jgi:hypothetical protein
MPFIYDDIRNRKHIAALFHKHIHRTWDIIWELLKGISEFDTLLYCETTRNNMKSKLNAESDAELYSALSDPVETRKYAYRYILKGSNALEIIMFYIHLKHKHIPNPFPMLFSSDWDTSVLINPNLPQHQFSILFDTMVPLIQKQLVLLSNKISNIPHFDSKLEAPIKTAKEFMDVADEYLPYRKYPIEYKSEKIGPVQVHDPSKDLPEVKRYIESLGLAGKGLHVTSNLRGGVDLRNLVTPPKFYLGRILLSVVASRNVWLPVELFDISMNYQNADLKFSWEAHSEYHIQHEGAGFRVLSPTSMYIDLSKCLFDAKNSSNQTKRNKIPARIQRLQQIMDSMIVPYKDSDEIIARNLERHMRSNTLVGNIRRSMNFTRKNTIR